MKSTPGINRRLRADLHELLDEPGEFKRWLFDQDGDRLLKNGEADGCALWEFLTDALCFRGTAPYQLEVHCQEVKWRSHAGSRLQSEDLPKWAAEFSTLDHDLGETGIKAINRDYAEWMLKEVLAGHHDLESRAIHRAEREAAAHRRAERDSVSIGAD